MNKTLSSIILAGSMALGQTALGQLLSRPQMIYDSINYRYTEFPQDTLVGYVTSKKTSKSYLIAGKDNCKVKIYTKDKEGYGLIIQKGDEEYFSDIHQDSLVTVYTFRVIGYEYNKNQFLDAKDLGLKARISPKKWSEKEFEKLQFLDEEQ